MKSSSLISRSGLEMKALYELSSTTIEERLKDVICIAGDEASQENPRVIAIYDGRPTNGVGTAITLADYINFPAGSIIIDVQRAAGAAIYAKHVDGTWNTV